MKGIFPLLLTGIGFGANLTERGKTDDAEK